MPRDIATFPISKSVVHKLVTAGYDNDSCFKDVSPLELSKETSLTTEEALHVIKSVRGTPVCPLDVNKFSAYAIAQKESSSIGIVTFSQAVDAMFGEGLPVGKLTEICGLPGVGKTQFSMQLAVDATIPEVFGGVQGQTIYIDTEGSFVAERVAQIAKATVQHCRTIANSTKSPEMLAELEKYDVTHILKSIHYFRCTSCVELIALTYQLSGFISSNCSNVKLIVIDSFAFHFRHDWEDMANRSRIMSSIALEYNKLAVDLSCAVVFVNQMTTKISDGESKIVPALGHSWSHIPSNRLLLLWKGGQRFANLFKSANRKEDTVPYCITLEGIRDVNHRTEFPPSTDSERPPSKRFKLAA